MLRRLLIGVMGFCLCAGSPVWADEANYDPRTKYGPEEHIMVPVEEIEWEKGPPSLPEGVEYVMLEGDLDKTGMFVMRLKFPDGYIIPPHTHPNFERVTVLSGTFNLGMGKTFDMGAAKRLDEGSFTTMKPGMAHFAFAEDKTIVQLTSIGPWEIEYINPKDDPRQ